MSHISNVWASKYVYFRTQKDRLNLKKPKNFNEKLMWLKIYDYNKNSLVWKCSDKYLSREYIKSKGISEDNLSVVLKVYNNVNDIKYDELPEKFALKCSHGCGFNIICNDKGDFDFEKSVFKLKKWLDTKYGYGTAETHYTHIKPVVILEKYIEKAENNNNDILSLPYDYKVYCFNGVPKCVLVCSEREKELRLNMYDLEWNQLNYIKDKFVNLNVIDKPDCLNEMIDISKKLSEDFPFVRIDYYVNNGKAVIGEMTFTPAACMANYYSDDGLQRLGEYLEIGEK